MQRGRTVDAPRPTAIPPETVLTIPPLIKRNTFFFAFAQALAGIGNQLVPTLSPIMVTQLLGTTSLAGIGSSIQGVSRFLVAYPIGRVMDAYGRRAGLVLGLIFGLVGTLWIGLSWIAASFAAMVVGLFVFGLGVGAVQQLRLAAADMYPPSRRAEGLGYVLTGSLVGAMGGPVLVSAAQTASASLGLDPYALAWLLVPVTIVPSIVFVLLVRPDPKEIAANLSRYYPGYRPATAAEHVGPIDTGISSPRAQYPRRVAYIASFAAQGNMTLMMAMTSLIMNHHGIMLPAISLTVAIHVIGMFGLSLPLGRLTDLAGRRAVILLGCVLAAAGSVLVPSTTAYLGYTVGLFLVGLGWSCVNVATSALIADATGPGERGRAIGINDTCSSLAAVLLPLVGGLAIDRFGFSSLSILGVALMLVPLVFTLRLTEIRPGRYAEPTTAR